jgi:hypothetical protein
MQPENRTQAMSDWEKLINPLHCSQPAREPLGSDHLQNSRKFLSGSKFIGMTARGFRTILQLPCTGGIRGFCLKKATEKEGASAVSRLENASIDPATQYCAGAPSISAPFCGNGWKSNLAVFLPDQ